MQLGLIFFFGSIWLGFVNWINGIREGQGTPFGTLTLITLSFLSGLQLILAFFSYDFNKTPSMKDR
jgi:hypothetical protein